MVATRKLDRSREAFQLFQHSLGLWPLGAPERQAQPLTLCTMWAGAAGGKRAVDLQGTEGTPQVAAAMSEVSRE